MRRFSVISRLKERGLVAGITEGVSELTASPRTFYIGFDPTAPSLHVGNLLGLVVSYHLRQYGWKPIFLVGGATARIGDPSFREAAKTRLEDHVLTKNTNSIKSQLLSLSNSFNQHLGHSILIDPPLILDNCNWLKEERLLDFLDLIGTQMRMSSMLSRESVQRRLSPTHSQNGMSFTEFTYQILQGYDFLHLHRHHGCRLQIGGSDQWGNMLAGVELIGKIMGNTLAHPAQAATNVAALTFPLLTTSQGEKMGKSAGNAIWLDPKMTPSYDLYQYFMKLSDVDAGRCLQLMTFLPLERIEELREQHKVDPEAHHLQQALAFELVAMVHSRQDAEDAKLAADLLFSKYDAVFSNAKYGQIVAKILKQTGRSVQVGPDDVNVPLLTYLKKLAPSHSNSTLS